MSNLTIPLDGTSDKHSLTDSDAKVDCDSRSPIRKTGPNQSYSDNSGHFASPPRQNNSKSSYYSYTYPITQTNSPHHTTSFPFFLSTSMGYNQAYCVNSTITEHGESTFPEFVSFGGAPVMTGSLTNVVNVSAVQQEPMALPNTAATPLSNTVPITFIQGPPTTFGQVHTPTAKPIWNGSPYIAGQGTMNSVVSPPNTPLSHSQPVSFHYMGGGNLHDISFDSLSIGPSMEDNISTSLTFDGSSVIPWGNNHEAEMYSISPLYMSPPQKVMVTASPHITSCPSFYSWPSPGPPIQMMPSGKGPDGANLFVFHIPNNFSNADLFNLFLPYGNVVSVRIMVEKDTGRSRGFGFVSYDLPESAALAIKNLNGFAIGHKRLKVQHKQIRSIDQEQSHDRHELSEHYEHS